MKGHYSSWGELGQGVPQESILGPLLFNIFLNDIFYSLTEGSLCNFADDNTISVTAKNTDELLQLVKINTKKCLDWFKSNEMIANPSKIQAFTIGSEDKCINEFEIDQKFAYSDYSSSYKKLLANSKETTIHVQSVRILALEVYKTLNNLNPVFMKDYLYPNQQVITFDSKPP